MDLMLNIGSKKNFRQSLIKDIFFKISIQTGDRN